jgi:putative NIF3 family GTP cyclohydrolase 1 type 2
MTDRLRTIGDPDAPIRTIAVCGGAGGDFIFDAVQDGVDLYITSDVKHHEGIIAAEHGLCLIDGGHWGTEHHFAAVVANHLRGVFGNSLEVYESQVRTDPFASGEW